MWILFPRHAIISTPFCREEMSTQVVDMNWHGIEGNPDLHIFNSLNTSSPMNNLLRGLIAGYGAKKLGGGCLGTVVVFILIWVALGQCQ